MINPLHDPHEGEGDEIANNYTKKGFRIKSLRIFTFLNFFFRNKYPFL